MVKGMTSCRPPGKSNESEISLKTRLKLATNLQPCNHLATDTISRRAAIDAVETKIKKWNAVDGEGYHVGLGLRYTDVIDTLTELPSAQPEPCEDAVSRNAIIQKLNTMDRYVSEELVLCDTDKRFPKNEVFIVDDVYEEIVENLPSAQPYTEAELQKMQDLYQAEIDKAFELGQEDARSEIIHCGECKHYYNSDESCEMIATRLKFYMENKTWSNDCYCSWAERMGGEADG